MAADFFNGFNGWFFGGGTRVGWQRIFLTDLTDGFFGGGTRVGWQRIFLTDLTDGFWVGEPGLVGGGFFERI